MKYVRWHYPRLLRTRSPKPTKHKHKVAGPSRLYENRARSAAFFSFELSNSAKRHVKIKLLFYYWFWRLAYIFSIHAICAARETLIFWLLIESKWWCVAGHRLEKKNKSNSPRLMAEFISIAVNQINVRFECSVARFMSKRERSSKPKTIDLPLAKRDCLISLHTKQYWLC